MPDSTKMVCKRPPTCEDAAACWPVKRLGELLVGGMCYGGILKKGAQVSAAAAAKGIGSNELSKYITAIPGWGCDILFDKAAEFLYAGGDGFYECTPAPTSTPPTK